VDLSQNRLLKHVGEGKMKGGIEVVGGRRRRIRGYRIILRKLEDIGNW